MDCGSCATIVELEQLNLSTRPALTSSSPLPWAGSGGWLHPHRFHRQCSAAAAHAAALAKVFEVGVVAAVLAKVEVGVVAVEQSP